MVSILGKIPTYEEYMEFADKIDPMADDIYRYLNFDKVDDYQEAASKAASKLAEIPVIVA